MKLNKILHNLDNSEERLPTFIDELDKLTGGLLVGGLSTIAGRPGMGKTAFAMTVVRNVGIQNKIPTAVLSLADDADSVARRLMATQFGWDNMNIWKHTASQTEILTDEQRDMIAKLQKIGFKTTETSDYAFLEKAKSAPVWIEHDINMNMDEIVSRMERLKRENDVRLLVIDSFGWITPESTMAASDIAMLKLIQAAEKLKMAVLMTCELTRAVETRGGTKKPLISDLRDSALIEKYSALVMFVYRPEYYMIYEDNDGDTQNKADIIVARNRRGNIGEVRLDFVNRARFVSRTNATVSLAQFFNFK